MSTRLAWFDHYDVSKDGKLDKDEIVAAILRDPRYNWERTLAVNCVDALWRDVDIDGSGDVDKREFSLQGGLADQLVELLDSKLESAAEWLMARRKDDFAGKDCGICICPVEDGEKARPFACGCLLHLECVGAHLGILIKERRVTDEELRKCPAQCGGELPAPIGPGIVRAAVSVELFERYLDNRLELEWAKQKQDRQLLVAECPNCRFLTVCKEQGDMLSVLCQRSSCPTNRFCAMCGDAPHKPDSCEEAKRKKDGALGRDEELHMIQELGFQRCPRCGEGGELQGGCKWMMCKCGG
eukprot:gene12196-53557_t